MDIADMLSAKPSRVLDQESAFVDFQQQLDEEEAIRLEAARRLRLLCDIMMGNAAFQSYDKNIEAASLISTSANSTFATNKSMAANIGSRSSDDDPSRPENASELIAIHGKQDFFPNTSDPDSTSDDDLTEIVV